MSATYFTMKGVDFMYGQPYYDPGVQQMYGERMAQLQQQYPQFFQQQQQYPQYNSNQQAQPQQAQQQPVQRQPEYLSGRAVTSVDEVRAVSADPLGGIGVYTDVGNKKIYTKQINTDGLAVLNTYVLDETPPPAPPEPKEYVEKSEVSTLFEQITYLTNKVDSLEGALSNAAATAATNNAPANSASNSSGKGGAKSGADVSTANAK